MKKRWMIDTGDSSEGHIGMCAYVFADTRQEALELFEATLPTEVQVSPVVRAGCTGEIDYFMVYISPHNLDLGDIEEAPL